jgi:UDP-N-acetylmuramoylalanine-D-glutamate ligase
MSASFTSGVRAGAKYYNDSIATTPERTLAGRMNTISEVALKVDPT